MLVRSVLFASHTLSWPPSDRRYARSQRGDRLKTLVYKDGRCCVDRLSPQRIAAVARWLNELAPTWLPWPYLRFPHGVNLRGKIGHAPSTANAHAGR